MTPFPRRQSMPIRSTRLFLMLGNDLAEISQSNKKLYPPVTLSCRESECWAIKLLKDELVVALFKRVNEREYLTTVGETIVALESPIKASAYTSMEISDLAQLRGSYSGIVSCMTDVALICRRH